MFLQKVGYSTGSILGLKGLLILGKFSNSVPRPNDRGSIKIAFYFKNTPFSRAYSSHKHVGSADHLAPLQYIFPLKFPEIMERESMKIGTFRTFPSKIHLE